MPTLNWRGKDAVLNHHLDVPYHLLKCEPELSAGTAGSGNLIVEGDNLVVLKALLPYYKGQVKCIYIDPPYNTGDESWVYNDNVNSPEMRDWLGKVVGKESEDLNRHDKWLCMMWPRLQLLKQFLNPTEGSIWISIDDNEAASLRMLMDEIFGRGRFIGTNVWQKRYSRENREAIGDVHEYIMLYAMDPEAFKASRNKLPLGEKQRSVYKNPNKHPDGLWRAVSFSAQGFRPNQMYEIVSPITGKCHRPPEGSCWKVIESEYFRLLAEGRMYFGKDGNAVPSRIQYLKDIDGIVPWTWWPHEEVGHTDEAKKEIQSIFGTQTAFPTPKPVRLIERILSIATNPGDLILDSFAGSGTTAHAAMKLNAESGGERKFILVEMDPSIAQSVTAERVRRIANGYTTGKDEAVPGLGGDFRYCTLGAPLFRGNGSLNEDLTRDTLARHLFFTEFGEPLTANPSKEGSLVGTFGETALHLLWGADGPGFLDAAALRSLPAWDGECIVFGEGCAIPASALQERRVSFRQIPYRVRG
jgi:hypothetical protein